MKNAAVTLTLMLTFAISAVYTAGHGAYICTAGQFFVGQSASVECNFPKDFSNKTNHFIMEWKNQCSLDATNEAINCHGSNPEDCELHIGMNLLHYGTDRLKLAIPNVTSDFAGIYTCQHVPANGFSKTSCSLTVQEPTHSVDKNTMPCSPKEKPTETEWTPNPTFYGVLSVGILLVILISITVVIVVKQQGFCKRSQTKGLGRTDQGVDDFQFVPWVIKQKIPPGLKTTLVKERLTSLDVLTELSTENIKDLNLKARDRLSMKRAMSTLPKASDKNAKQEKEFVLDDWMTESNLSREAKKALKKNEMTTFKILTEEVNDEDVKALKLKMGDMIRLLAALKSLRDTRGSTKSKRGAEKEANLDKIDPEDNTEAEKTDEDTTSEDEPAEMCALLTQKQDGDASTAGTAIKGKCQKKQDQSTKTTGHVNNPSGHPNADRDQDAATAETAKKSQNVQGLVNNPSGHPNADQAGAAATAGAAIKGQENQVASQKARTYETDL